jgi:histone H1/5
VQKADTLIRSAKSAKSNRNYNVSKHKAIARKASKQDKTSTIASTSKQSASKAQESKAQASRAERKQA